MLSTFRDAVTYPAAFWWKTLQAEPLPRNLSSPEEVQGRWQDTPLMGFNGQTLRAFLLQSIHEECGCTRFVETGAYRGQTSATARRLLGVPVDSCEIHTGRYLTARLLLAPLPDVRVHHMDSIDFLEAVTADLPPGETPLFYLDAHGADRFPLADELELLGDRCPEAVVAVDDCRVPTRPGFGYDTYGEQAITPAFVQRAVERVRPDADVWVGDYDPRWDAVANASGLAVVAWGKASGVPRRSDFPFDLLTRHGDLGSPS